MKRFFQVLSLFVVAATLLGLSAPAVTQPTPQVAHAHPLLVQMAADDPEQLVSVIVQKLAGSTGLDSEVARLGGEVTQDLAIINAFAAEMTASAALELATSSNVRWVSLDSPMVGTNCPNCVSSANLDNNYVEVVRADEVWNASPPLQGQGIGVAVLDSGVNWQTDLYTIMGQNRVVAAVNFHTGYNQTPWDGYGHGSHVAGVIGGNGRSSDGKYIGIAPLSNIINVKVCDDLENGMCTAQSVVSGLQWVLNNKDAYNIRVVNISLNASIPESYHTSPIDAAVEILWFNGIVVVVSAGNHGVSNLYAPANDPFAIVVGAVDTKNSIDISDDHVAGFSSYGLTGDGFAKPDLVAPGKNIVSLMGNQGMGLPADHPDNIVDGSYFMMSGTSVAAPVVSGAVALLLQDEPNLTPDQVKYRLMATANSDWPFNDPTKAGAGILDVYAAIHGTTTENANTGVLPSQLLATGSEPISWGSVGWNSVGWNSVGWNSVGWNSVGWNSVGWNSDAWDD
jgi:serine protease AprX